MSESDFVYQARLYHSDPAIPSHDTEQFNAPIHSKSEPVLASHKKHPLLDQDDSQTPHSYHDYLFAAETLENIVNEGAFVGTIKTKYKWFSGPKSDDYISKELSDRVLKLVYGTMKYLPYIDHVLVKTQFLVFNNQFLDSLGLVKIMLYDLMTHHFNYKTFHGIDYTMPQSVEEGDEKKYQQYCIDLVQDLEETLCAFQVKLGAAYARLRIEKQAGGESAFEQMNNMLPESVRSKEEMAIEMIKTLRINTLKYSKKEVVQKMQSLGYLVELSKLSEVSPHLQERMDRLIYLDDDFSDLLVIPPALFSDIKASALVKEGYLIFQDKASMYCPSQLKSMVKPGDIVLDARAGCGTKLAQLSEMVGKKGRIIAFEHRPARLETIQSHIKLIGCKSKSVRVSLHIDVTVIEDEFIMANFKDPMFAEVSTIIVEPANSGTTVIDKLGFMLQEEEYPVDHLTQKDLYTLKRQQTATLKHAFKFPKVKNIVYLTRSIHSEENEQVVTDTLDRYGVEWKLSCVLPDIPSDKIEGTQAIEECLTICPSAQTGNGIFIANFQLKPLVHEIHRQDDPETIAKKLAEQSISHLENEAVVERPKRKKKPVGRKRGEPLKIKLPKALRASVDRLSIPRLFSAGREAFERKRSVSQKPLIVSKQSSQVEVGNAQEEGQGEAHIQGDGENRPSTSHEGDVEKNGDIGVYGISLKKFFGPRSEAIEALKKQQHSTTTLRWVYPIPNPRVWK